MSNNRVPTWLLLIILGIGGLITFVVGLFAYVSLTATPLHPNVKDIPSALRATPLPRWAGTADEARQIVRAVVKAQNLPGASVAVGIAGDIVWAEGFGFADLETRAPVTPQMRFRAGEASTLLTSAAVGRLLEQNRLTLDEEIQTYVPGYPKKPWPVTLRQLMGHLAGVRTDAGDEASADAVRADVDGLRLFADESLLFEPAPGTAFELRLDSGERGDRSGGGYAVLHVHAEAGLRAPRHGAHPRPIPGGGDPGSGDVLLSEVRRGHPLRAGKAREGDHPATRAPARSCPRRPTWCDSGWRCSGTLLKPATVRLLQTSQRLPSGEETGYGLGWRLETVGLAGSPARMAGHGTKSDFIGDYTYLMTFPERGLVVAAMSNTSFADMRAVALKVAQAFAARGQDPADR